jgi:hypothetical protein
MLAIANGWLRDRVDKRERLVDDRPYRPATVFDFRWPLARGRAHALTGEVLGPLPAGRPAPGRAPPRAIDYSYD